MKRHMGVMILAAVAVVLLAGRTVMFTVASTDVVLVKTFGKTTRVLDGRNDADAGLHFKWIYPIQTIVRYDGRGDVFEDASKELETFDKQNILVTMHCEWRIVDARKFNEVIKTVKDGREQIRGRLKSKQGAIISRHAMRDFVNTDPKRLRLKQIAREIEHGLKALVEDEYGVEILMVGIRSLGLGETTSQAVIDAMKKERRNEVARYESMGEAQAEAIRSRAESARRQILAFAERKADEMRTEGYREAAGFYSRFEANPRLGMFLRYLDTLRAGLKDNATIWLDGTKIVGIKFLRDGPSLPKGPPKMPQTKKPGAGK